MHTCPYLCGSKQSKLCIKSKSLKIVCQLGGFHTIMSFVGCIGSVMKCSGLEIAYGPKCSYSDNVRQSNFRSFTWPCFVLVNKLMSALLPCEVESNFICSKSAGDSGLVMIYVADAMTNLQIFESHKENQEGSMLISEVAESDEVLKLEECLAKYKAPLVEQFLTAKLWLQYIETLKLFIRAERPGNWSLHLVAVTTFLLQLAI